MIRREPPKFLWGFFPTQAPRITSTRGGTSFWKTASADGIRSVVLTVPVTFPPEELHHGAMLGGLPLPDLRATLGTFYYWATDLSSYEEGNTEFGGFLKRLLFDGGVSETVLKGPESPILKQEEAALREKKKAGSLSEKEQARLDELATGKDINLPMTVRWTEGQGRAEIEIQGQKLSLKTGEWSEWVPLTFKVNALIRVHGMTQFHVSQAERELRVYASPVNMDPRDPPTAISKPDSFSSDLAEKIGLYRTLGWAESADKPLNEGRLDEAEFLYDSERAMQDREKVILQTLKDDREWDLFVAAIETTDRVSHMMWRLIDPRHPMYDQALAAKYGGAIEQVYRRADDFVGRLRQQVPKDALFLVMSDHGFHSFRREVNLNTWLLQNGYMTVHGQSKEKTLQDLFGRGKFFEGVDWSKTRAYAVGLGQIYFNLKGRESQGIVSAGEEYRQLQEEIRAKLVTLVDPETSERVLADVYRRDDIYSGEYLQMAPDLQAGFLDGYRVGWQDTLGTIRRGVVENNNKKWSGDHCATATEISHGVLFSNRRVPVAEPSIMDLAPSVLKLLDAPIPADYDGKPIW
jgi:predicted AlkP superfamily phosphohydrolase/phosphomutase